MDRSTRVEDMSTPSATDIFRLMEKTIDCTMDSTLEDFLDIHPLEHSMSESVNEALIEEVTAPDYAQLTSTPVSKRRKVNNCLDGPALECPSSTDDGNNCEGNQLPVKTTIPALVSDPVPPTSYPDLQIEKEIPSLTDSETPQVNEDPLKDPVELCCPHCSIVIKDEKNFKRHIKLHAKAPFVCRLCDKPYHRKDELDQHITVVHGGQRYSCEQCHKEFLSKKTLKLHVAGHSGNFKHVCDHCGQGFQYVSNFQAHVNNHVGDKPFKCTNCSYKTGAPTDLIKHKQSCGKEDKEYECDLCHKFYKTKRSLACHKKGHAQPKRYVCCICGKGYPFSSSLINHEKKCS